MTIADDPLFDADWPESARPIKREQVNPGYGLAPAPDSTDEQIIALATSRGLSQDKARSYLRGWRQPK